MSRSVVVFVEEEKRLQFSGAWDAALADLKMGERKETRFSDE